MTQYIVDILKFHSVQENNNLNRVSTEISHFVSVAIEFHVKGHYLCHFVICSKYPALGVKTFMLDCGSLLGRR